MTPSDVNVQTDSHSKFGHAVR